MSLVFYFFKCEENDVLFAMVLAMGDLSRFVLHV
jgi:hypothetical protein